MNSNSFPFEFLWILVLSLSTVDCSTPEGVPGRCISVYQCPQILGQFQGQLTPAATSYLRSLQCEDGIGDYPHVCCIAQQAPFLPSGPRRRQGSPSTRLTPFNRRTSGSSNILPSPGVCGLTSVSERIIGGYDTQLDDYPWTVLLEYESRKYITSFSLIGRLPLFARR